MSYEFRLPDIGEGIAEGEIVQWLVKPGDTIREDQAIVEVMTDKVTAEIPSPVSGVLKQLNGKPGDVVKVGAVIAVFDTAGASSAGKHQATEKAAAAEKIVTTPSNGKSSGMASCTTATNISVAGQKVLAAPATRKLARELGVDLGAVTGTGPRGRVTPDDVQAITQQAKVQQTKTAVALSAFPASATYGQAEERRPFTGIRRKIAEHLVHAKHTAPHFAYVEEVDMTNLVALRQQLQPAAEAKGVKLTYLPFMMKAVIAALREFPVLNASLDDAAQELVLKHYYNLGMAVATDQGLIVPVIKHAEQKSLLALAQEVKTLSDKARAGKLALDELQGGTFTLTSIGSIGGLFGVPIINHPEVAILGINKISRRPVVRVIDGQEQVVIRDMMHLSLSCDHRVVDGAEAALFTKKLIEILENPGLLLLN